MIVKPMDRFTALVQCPVQELATREGHSGVQAQATFHPLPHNSRHGDDEQHVHHGRMNIHASCCTFGLKKCLATGPRIVTCRI